MSNNPVIESKLLFEGFVFTVNMDVEHKLLQSFHETNQRKYELELNTFFFYLNGKACQQNKR